MSQPQAHTGSRRPGRAAGAAAAVIATGALACGVCCVLPFALPAAALAMSGGALAWLGGLYAWATLAAVVTVGVAWAWVGVQSLRSRRPPARSTMVAMSIASLMLAAALAWPGLEAIVVGLLRT